MGGNVFEGTRRYSKEEYLSAQDKWVNYLSDQFTVGTLSIVKEKETFGDLDLVVTGNKEKLIEILINHYPLFINGNIISIKDNDFQVDLILVPEISFKYSIHYFGCQDLGNLLGRLIKQYGFKHGWNGLYYVQRNGDHVVQEHLLSTRYLDIINILGLDRYKFLCGFNSYEDMFDWLVKSPLFISSIFKYENLNHTNRVRDRKRKVYNLFLDYIDKLDDSIKNKETTKLSEEEKRSFVFSKFPKLALEVERLDKEIEIHNITKLKFNGELVKSLTGLSGVPLGDFIKLFKSNYNDNWIFNTSQYEINLLIKKIYQNL